MNLIHSNSSISYFSVILLNVPFEKFRYKILFNLSKITGNDAGIIKS